MNPSPRGVLDARDFAVAAHGDQLYGDQPYVVHLDRVCALLAGEREHLQVVAYLHDVVEDTSVTVESIGLRFGYAVAGDVFCLTDPPGQNRKTRKALAYARMAEMETPYTALLVKSADRLANVQASIEADDKRRVAMYRKEQETFRAAVWRGDHNNPYLDRIDVALGLSPGSESKQDLVYAY